MRPYLSKALRAAAACFLFAAPVLGAPAPKARNGRAGKADGRPADRGPRPILLVANEVIERAMPRLFAPPADTASRISVKDGLVGLGSYDPRGGADFGMYAPPRHLFPRVGAGNSLNVDPNTGRSYFTNTP